MVYPEVEYLDTGDGGKYPLPRMRQYFAVINDYEAIIQPHDNGKSLPLFKISKKLFTKYDDIEIFFLTRKKLRIKSKNINTINELVKDELRKDYRIFIPPELCETKAVVQVPADDEFTEEYIFKNMEVKHLPEYGILQHTPRLVEVKRFTKPDGGDGRIGIDLVMLSFSGIMLPSHVVLDRIIFPVQPFIERTIQCTKCWRHGHSEKICRRSKRVCANCGTSHEGVCERFPVCVNCGKLHDAKFNGCEVKIIQRQKARDKAYERVPKKYDRNINSTPMVNNVFSINEEDFPTLSNKRKKFDEGRNKNRKRKNEKVINDINTNQYTNTEIASQNLPNDDSFSEASIDVNTPIETRITEQSTEESINQLKTQQIPTIQDIVSTQKSESTLNTQKINDNIIPSINLHEFENFTKSIYKTSNNPLLDDEDHSN